MIPYNNCKIFGPYSYGDQRLRIVVQFPDGSTTTISYPKYLTEIRLNRYLDEDETVDHNDGDFRNNEESNLVIRKLKNHSELDAKRLKSQTFMCPVCYFVFTLEGKQLHDAYTNRQLGKTGPYCSKSCAGIGSTKITQVKREYTTRKNENTIS